MRFSKSLFAFIFCGLFFFAAPFISRKWNNTGNQAVISWDVNGYWFYLPSFFYDDLGKLHNYDSIYSRYSPSIRDETYIVPETGSYVMNYPCGMAIINLPAFAAGHIWASACGYRIDGFSRPYQLSLTFWCVIVSCLGLWILRRLLRRYFEDWLVAVVMLVLCIATNYLNFVSFSPMTHAFLFTLYTAILYLTDTFYIPERRRWWQAPLIGLLSGLATITRPTEIICVFIPLLWGVGSIEALKKRLYFFVANKWIVLTYLTAAFVAALPQLIYWKVYAGHWLFFSYHGDDKTFSFLQPHIFDILMSYRKGWFMYTPVMIISIAGFYQLYKNYSSLFWCIALFTVINIYLVSAWDIWWYGGSFSMRALVQSYPLLMFPMAAFLADTLRRKYWKYIAITFLLFCTWLNLLMTYEVNTPMPYGSIDGDEMTKEYYWRIFGKYDITPQDRKLLDTDEELPEKLKPALKEIYRIDMDKVYNDSIVTFQGKKCFVLDGTKEWTERFTIPVDKSRRNGWYRVYSTVFYPDKELKKWDQTQLNVGFYGGGTMVKEKIIRIQRITDSKKWQQVYIDIRVPRDQDYDILSTHFWNHNCKTIYMTDIRVMYTPGP